MSTSSETRLAKEEMLEAINELRRQRGESPIEVADEIDERRRKRMEPPLVDVVVVLGELLALSRSERADELRLLSGQRPQLVVRGVLRPAARVLFSSSIICAIHWECLSRALRMDTGSHAVAEYAFAVPGFGTFRCAYALQPDSVSLSIYPDDTSTETVAAVLPRHPPGLSVEANPDKAGRKSED